MGDSKNLCAEFDVTNECSRSQVRGVDCFFSVSWFSVSSLVCFVLVFRIGITRFVSCWLESSLLK